MIRLFLGNLYQYVLALENQERRGIDAGFAELLIKEGVEDRKFLEDQQKMLQLKETLNSKGYDVGDVTWNEDRKAYNLVVNLVDTVKRNGDSAENGSKKACLSYNKNNP